MGDFASRKKRGEGNKSCLQKHPKKEAGTKERSSVQGGRKKKKKSKTVGVRGKRKKAGWRGGPKQQPGVVIVADEGRGGKESAERGMDKLFIAIPQEDYI